LFYRKSGRRFWSGRIRKKRNYSYWEIGCKTMALEVRPLSDRIASCPRIPTEQDYHENSLRNTRTTLLPSTRIAVELSLTSAEFPSIVPASPGDQTQYVQMTPIGTANILLYVSATERIGTTSTAKSVVVRLGTDGAVLSAQNPPLTCATLKFRQTELSFPT